MLTVGDILRKEREKQGLTLADIEKKIHVRRKYLEFIEKSQWGDFSSKIYIVGVIRNYARVLSLPPEKAIAFFRREYERSEETGFKRKVSKSQLTSETRFALYAVVASMFLSLALYFGFQLKTYFTPPSITIVSPSQTTFEKVESVTVRAVTTAQSQVEIFGNRIIQDENGEFEYNFPLKTGKNTLVIKVTGPNGQEAALTQDYVLEAQKKKK